MSTNTLVAVEEDFEPMISSCIVGIPDFRVYKILAVDDHQGDLRLLQEAFADCGHPCQLTCANSTKEAQKILQTNRFDLVVSDLGTRSEGIELIQIIRDDVRLQATPVIVLSGMVDPTPAYEAGANAFLSKSADLDTFFCRIRDLMNFWVNVAELPLRKQHETNEADPSTPSPDAGRTVISNLDRG
jgi:CheY-like chemotaxis protein